MRWLLLGIISTLLGFIGLLSHRLEQAQLTAAQQVIQAARLQEQANQAQRAQRATLTLRRTDAAIHTTSV
jgi:hypothetical protein